MKTPIIRGIRYWFRAYLHPEKTLKEFHSDPNKILVSFWINFLFALLYVFTALLGFLTQRALAVEPWLPIAADTYYLYQTFWTVPWGLGTWILISGVGHLLAQVGNKEGTKGQFEDTLFVVTIGWIVPWSICGWLPETLILIPFDIWPPLWLELVRYMILPILWQTVLITLGLRITHEVSWIKGVLIGLISNGIVFILFMTYMR
ncbi:MAG: YIP1 family protein [Promethearchaeota archaeon]